MSQDMFIKIKGAPGESLDEKHKNEIQVLSWNWSVSQNANMHSGSGGGAGKASVADFFFEHYIDKASPNLLRGCLSGSHIGDIQFVVRKAGGDPLEYLVITFTEAIITSVSRGGSNTDDCRPREQVSFSFTKMAEDYVPQSDKGSRSGMISASYDVKANRLD